MDQLDRLSPAVRVWIALLLAEWQRVIGVSADGVYGPATDRATRAWQSARGLTADGVVGPGASGGGFFCGDRLHSLVSGAYGDGQIVSIR